MVDWRKTFQQQTNFLRVRHVGHLALEYFRIMGIPLWKDFRIVWVLLTMANGTRQNTSVPSSIEWTDRAFCRYAQVSASQSKERRVDEKSTSSISPEDGSWRISIFRIFVRLCDTQLLDKWFYVRFRRLCRQICYVAVVK